LGYCRSLPKSFSGSEHGSSAVHYSFRCGLLSDKAHYFLFNVNQGLYFHAGKILVLTVGLPARGKTHISRALERYLRWMGIKTQVVSLGDYRRRALGSAQALPPDYFTLGESSLTH
jgi:hypothetical protein